MKSSIGEKNEILKIA